MKKVVMNESDMVSIRPDVLSRTVNGEELILDLEDGKYFGLSEVGVFIWQAIKEPISLNHLIDAILQEYEVERAAAQEDLLQLLGELQEKGLVTIESAR